MSDHDLNSVKFQTPNGRMDTKLAKGGSKEWPDSRPRTDGMISDVRNSVQSGQLHALSIFIGVARDRRDSFRYVLCTRQRTVLRKVRAGFSLNTQG
jgi:hypothetical protein